MRPDGSQVHLLSVLDTGTGRVRAQREIEAKTNEIPELAPAVAHLDLAGTVVTLDALHTQAETARHLVEDKHAHYLLIVTGNQPTLLATVAAALADPDKGLRQCHLDRNQHRARRHERRSIRTAPAAGIACRTPPRSSGSAATPHPRTAPGPARKSPTASPARPPAWPAPATCVRNHWGIENREHYVRDKTFCKDLQQVRTGNQPNAYAAIRNLVIGAFRRAGYANIAHARRLHSRDDQRILALYGYT